MKIFLTILLLTIITTKTLSSPIFINKNSNNNNDIAELFNNWQSQEQATSFCNGITTFISNSSKEFIKLLENMTNSFNNMLGLNSLIPESNIKKTSAAPPKTTKSPTSAAATTTTSKTTVEIVDNSEKTTID
ncbi:hypothetical protein FF38_06153 [Lucilia cuprina]|uniref:Uncharacterized protein n=1 Tax=Lucilia cuprina TaxID=7375 RepID=A0A0L0C6P0_LUCCU|nr:hypothetical protein CVS40_0435 [Lucilia cuprina]KNC27897.1 hypothetical protein FF38_06153 [Lucilia cuprina]